MTLRRLTVACVFALAAAAAANSPARAVEPQIPTSALTPRPMWIEKVKDGLYVVRGPVGPCMGPCGGTAVPDGYMHEPGDVAVRVTPEGLILVDVKFKRDVPELLKTIRTVTNLPVKYVFASHFHQDHVGGLGELIEGGATAVASEALRASYDRTKPDGPSPQVTFDDYGAVYLGGAKVEAYRFGAGHTRGDTFVYFPDLKVVHTGDVVISGMPHIDYTDGGSAMGWVKEIYDLLKLDFDWAIPGHGKLLTREEILQYVKNIEIMNARAKDLVRQGVPAARAVQMLKLDDLWPKSGSYVNFVTKDFPDYYAEMAAVLAAERKLGAP